MTSRAFPSFLLLALAASAAGGADARCHRSAMNAAASAGDYSAPSAAPPARPFHKKSEQRELGTDEDASAAPAPVAAASTVRTARENGEANHFQDPVPVQAPRPRAAVPPPPERVFSVAPGDTLRGVLTRWAASSGWEVVWEPANDYALSAAAGFTGPFPEAVTRLLESLQANGAPYGAELYKGNRVIRVTRVR